MKLQMLTGMLFVICGSASHAATLTTFAQFDPDRSSFEAESGDCGLVQSSATLRTTCVKQGFDGDSIQDATGTGRFQANMRAEAGNLGVEVSLGTSNNFSGIGDASVTVQDQLTFGISNGSVVFSLDVDGLLEFSFDPAAPVGSSAASQVTSGVDVFFNAITRDNRVPIVTADERFGVTQTGDGRTLTQSDGFTSRSVRAQFRDGFLEISSGLSATVTCRLAGEFCLSSASAFNSLRFTGATVFDTNGDIVSTSLTSSSGFDYLTGIDPHDVPTAAVPLPASLTLLIAGLSGLAVVRRRKK